MLSSDNKYAHLYSVTAADMNKDYRLTPSAVLLYYQDCWARSMAVHQLAAFDLIKQDKIWVITEFSAQFLQEAFWSDELQVVVWNSEISPLRVYSDFQIIRTATDTLVAQGYACWNLLNAKTKKLERVDEIPSIPYQTDQLTLSTHRKPRFSDEGNVLRKVEHTINQLDLDFNGHVNNRSYLSIAMLTAPDEFLHTFAPESVHLQWLRETFYGDTLTCTLSQLSAEQHEYLHQLRNSQGDCVAKIHSFWKQKTHPVDVCTVVTRQ